jgi:hypothetical protein
MLVLGVASAGALGCEYTPKTTVTVRDPSAVRVEIDEGKGLHTLLAPSSQAETVAIPGTVPPYHEGLREKTALERQSNGAIEIACGTCIPERKVLVPPDGNMPISESFQTAKIDFTQSELRLHFTDDRGGPYSTTSTYDADAVTPWKNVVKVERVSAPNRTIGERLLITAAVAGAIGAFSLIDGVGNHHTTTTVFGAVFIPVGVILLAAGGWYELAPADEKVLFKGKSEAPATDAPASE